MNISAEKDDEMPADRLWTIQDLSYYLGVPVATLYQWRCQNFGPAGSRMGRFVRYRPKDVRAWVASRVALDAA
jgi:predicted DNA-binding transcriptional regulator AlpA